MKPLPPTLQVLLKGDLCRRLAHKTGEPVAGDDGRLPGTAEPLGLDESDSPENQNHGWFYQ